MSVLLASQAGGPAAFAPQQHRSHLTVFRPNWRRVGKQSKESRSFLSTRSWVAPIADWAAMHHENLLGTGYPFRGQAKVIPRETSGSGDGGRQAAASKSRVMIEKSAPVRKSRRGPNCIARERLYALDFDCTSHPLFRIGSSGGTCRFACGSFFAGHRVSFAPLALPTRAGRYGGSPGLHAGSGPLQRKTR